MGECANCGRPIEPTAPWCPHCGTTTGTTTGTTMDQLLDGPARRQVAARSGPAGWLVVLLVGVLVVAVAGLGSAFAASRHWTTGSAEPQPGVVPVAPATVAPPQPTTSAAPLVPANPTVSAGPSESAPPDSSGQQPTTEAQAQADLTAEVSQDQAAAEQLIGSWVPQLSSKRPGLVVNGTTYDDLAIWQDFQTLRGKYQNVLLIWSGNYSTYLSGNFWVTIVDQAYPDGAAANGWCDSENIDPTDCYAKLLSHTAGPNGASLPRS